MSKNGPKTGSQLLSSTASSIGNRTLRSLIVHRVSSGETFKSSVVFDHESSYCQNENKNVSNLGGSFSQSKKEKAYHMTNSSDVNFLHSFKALDVPKGEESKVIPAKKLGVPAKLNLNQSKSYANVSHPLTLCRAHTCGRKRYLTHTNPTKKPRR